MVSNEGIQTGPEKVEAIKNFPEPKSVFHVRSLLGLPGYYRGFIKDFAFIAKHLTDLLKDENSTISAQQLVNLNVEQLNAFHK